MSAANISINLFDSIGKPRIEIEMEKADLRSFDFLAITNLRQFSWPPHILITKAADANTKPHS